MVIHHDAMKLDFLIKGWCIDVEGGVMLVLKISSGSRKVVGLNGSYYVFSSGCNVAV